MDVEMEYSPMIKEKGLQVRRGSKDDTVLLNTNFKTLLVTYFREKIFLKELN